MKITKRTFLILFTAVTLFATAIVAVILGVFTAPVTSYAAAETTPTAKSPQSYTSSLSNNCA